MPIRPGSRDVDAGSTPPIRRSRRAGLLTGATVSLAALALYGGGVGTAVSGGPPVASAQTSVHLYVATNGTTRTCSAPGTAACSSVQDAINAAEGAGYDGDEVTIDVAAGTYTENDTIDDTSISSLAIVGAGASASTVNADGNGTVFSMDGSPGAISISGVTITGGFSDGYAGGIYNAGGTLTLTDDTVSNDYAGSGGGIYNDLGTLTLLDDTVSDDTAYSRVGGGIYTDGGTMRLTDDALSDDNASRGGGIYNDLGTLTLLDDTVSDDNAFSEEAGGGGGIYTASGTATLTDDTLSNDHSSSSGGGVYSLSPLSGRVTLTDDTLANDSAPAGGGIYSQVSQSLNMRVANSILDAAGCGGLPITDGGYNVESDDSCGFGSSDVVDSSNIDLASELAANGSSGPETVAITSSSSAHDEVPKSACTTTTDERGDARPGLTGQTSCDAGAFELQSLVQGSPTSATTSYGKAYTERLRVTNAAETVSYTTTGGTSPVRVSSAGAVSVPATTPAGTYTVSGADSDALGESGTWAFSVTVAKAATKLTASAATVTGASVKLSADLTSAVTRAGIARQAVSFTLASRKGKCSAKTNAKGVATCSVRLGAGHPAPPSFSASFAGSSDYRPSSATGKVKKGAQPEANQHTALGQLKKE